MALHTADLAISVAVGSALLAAGIAAMSDMHEVTMARSVELTNMIGDKEGNKGLSKRLKDAIKALGEEPSDGST